MSWFGYQRGSGGNRVPVLFDERPAPEWEMSAYLIWDTLKEVPLECEDMTLSQIESWLAGGREIKMDTVNLEDDLRARITELLEANSREVERRRVAEIQCELLKTVLKTLL